MFLSQINSISVLTYNSASEFKTTTAVKNESSPAELISAPSLQYPPANYDTIDLFLETLHQYKLNIFVQLLCYFDIAASSYRSRNATLQK